MDPRKMAPEQQWTAVGRGLAWLLGVTLVVWVACIPGSRSVGGVFAGLFVGFMVGCFVGWFVWWRRMYLTRDGRVHQAWRRERRAAKLARNRQERAAELARRQQEEYLAAQAAEWQRIAQLRMFVINRWRTYTGNYDGMPSDAEIARMMMDAEAEGAAQARHADAMNQQASATALIVGSVYGVGMQMNYLAHHPQVGR